ncbi:MAG: succinylglutamate desuccinylase/aspartoacylase family protein [Winogradskyella sp.]|nr:succinylglutamate desuccinylase/aspartoacylase family protein [Winogradskyella sp.]
MNKMQESFKTQTKPNDLPNRVFHHIIGKSSGSTIVFFAGIHGNERAGVEALNNTLKNISENKVCGEVYAVFGNLKALKKNKRYLKTDLNRLWTSKQIKELQQKRILNEEEQEQKDLLSLIEHILHSTKAPIYFIDLHTTSSKTIPFITINDALINRKFSRCFSVPVILGIEEYLEGPLLSYLNTLGYVAIGFESGQHTDPEAIKNCEAFIHLALKQGGQLHINNITQYHNQLVMASKDNTCVFEVIYKYHIKSTEEFVMQDGFESFQTIKKGILLAQANGKNIYADYNAQLFMPLYQKSGNDGFFIIKPIPEFFLKLSEILRRIKADTLLTILPGISWHNKDLGVLKANLLVTRFMAKSVFHLFGYRNKQLDKNHLLLYNRERVSKTRMYKDELWY